MVGDIAYLDPVESVFAECGSKCEGFWQGGSVEGVKDDAGSAVRGLHSLAELFDVSADVKVEEPVGVVFCEACQARWGREDCGHGPAFDGAGGVFLKPGAVLRVEERPETVSACCHQIEIKGAPTGWDDRSDQVQTQKVQVRPPL